jgi:hypothetical protein
VRVAELRARSLTGEQVEQATGRLSDPHRNVLIHVHYRGRTPEEVAAALEVPVSTIRRRLYFALRSLRVFWRRRALRVSGSVYLRKRKRGDQWFARYRIDGRRFNRKLGPAWKEKGRPPAGFYTERKAQEALQAILTDARRGKLAIPDPVRDARTYSDAVEEWLRYVEHERGNSPNTVYDYRRTAEKRLVPEFGKDTELGSITTERIDEYRERLLTEGQLSRRSVQKLLVINHGILKRAKRKGWIRGGQSLGE